MSTENKYDYDAACRDFANGHIYTAEVEELRKYLSGLATATESHEINQMKASRMSEIICRMIDSRQAEWNHKENMDSIAESRDSAKSARIAAWVASVAVCLQVLLQIVKLICTQQ
ncbi:hypothetical protein QEH52_19730 [Coraliomargarita sp. SDUM461003]|uniref:Uncharacterized protein n=1 Tax=Thalassobacterium maritimum TaxID=3041265 RepID=A0ABU1B038_9BACT|nr:hypothetical protein [Coraliomargarita sp. SDUM461003]MDQ8209759.1 hypothetical protein [Coraliomargarita sp. SDUM461003]